MSTKIKTSDGWKDVTNLWSVPGPDWANAIAVSAAQLYAGYTAPTEGLIVCTGFMPEISQGAKIMTINNVPVARGQFTDNANAYSYSNVCCPVNKDDLIKTDTISAWSNETRYFVPYKN